MGIRRRDSGAYLPRFSWTHIVRHTLVKGEASPDDPDLARYWANRRSRVTFPLHNGTLRLLTKQDMRCPICREPLLTAERPPQSPNEWEKWWSHTTHKRIINTNPDVGSPNPPDETQTRLIHATCYRTRATHSASSSPAPHPNRPRGPLEPCAATSGTHGSEEAAGAAMRPPLSDKQDGTITAPDATKND